MGQELIDGGGKEKIISKVKIAFRIWIRQARQRELGQIMKSLKNQALELKFPSVDSPVL